MAVNKPRRRAFARHYSRFAEPAPPPSRHCLEPAVRMRSGRSTMIGFRRRRRHHISMQQDVDDYFYVRKGMYGRRRWAADTRKRAWMIR